MEKKDLISLLDEIFIPLSFKRKGNSWVLNGSELSKVINLQKSNYGTAFYINYGYIINGLNLTTTTHVENRLSSSDREEQKVITDLLDLENNIDDSQRLIMLKKLVVEKIVKEMASINTQEDLLKELQRRPHLHNIPLIVKEHFNLV
jgi:hypothetical protein